MKRECPSGAPNEAFRIGIAALTFPFCLRRSVGQSCRGSNLPRNAEYWVSRDSPPWRTQLRKRPTESRDPEVFEKEAVVDGARVEVVQYVGNFAEVRTVTGCQGWVQRRYLHGRHLQAKTVSRVEVDERFDEGDTPVVLVDAVPSVKGWKGHALPRMLRLNEIMDSVQLRCKLAAAEDPCMSSSRKSPKFLRYGLAAPATPIVLGAWREGVDIAFRGFSRELLRSLDLVGYLSIPGDIVLDALPQEILPPGPDFACAMLGEGADLFLCRPPIICGHSISVLAGQLTIRLLPPTCEAPGDALIGDLGAALSQCNLFGNEAEESGDLHEAELGAGDVLLIPPGWWHQCLDRTGATTLAVKPYLNKEMISAAWQELSRMLNLDQAMTPDAKLLWKTLKDRTCLQLGTSAWPFWPSSPKDDASDDRFRSALEDQPGFVYSGMVLPSDVDLWSNEDFQRFVATAGFIAPSPERRGLKCEPRTAPARLREWLETPIDAKGQLPHGEAPKVIWMYWAQGSQQLTGFRRLCVHSWGAQNPDWQGSPRGQLGEERSQVAGATSVVAASASAGGRDSGGYYRDRDPPPSYNGEEPELTFRSFEKSVKLWEFETDVPPVKRGAKLLRSLEGQAKLAVDEMTFEEITSEKGIQNIMDRLREYFVPHLEVSLPRAFEAAVYGTPRQSKEGFNEYLARMDKAFSRLRKEGVDLPDGAQGYILYRQASLNESQDQRFLVWADGRYDRKSVIHALRKLDKVLKEKSKGHFVSEGDPEYSEAFLTEDPYGMIAEDDDENYVYLQEGDLDNILEEDDVLAAMASYQEIRKAVKDQQKGRGFYKGFGKKGFGKAEGKGKWKRVHQEQVKLRTRCWKCGQVGHLSRECRSESNAKTNQSSSGASLTSSTAGKSGFFVTSDDTVEGMQSQYWLKKFVEDRAKTRSASPHGAYKSGAAQFCGICTSAEQGIVDTAAEGGLVGSCALARIEKRLNERGLKVMWIPKKTSAKGVGGQATVVGVAMLPIGIGGVNGLLEITVVEGDVPLLLPIRMMTALKTIIDLNNMTFNMKLYDVAVDMFQLASGHVAIDVMQFATEGFKVPEGAAGFSQEDFQLVRQHGDVYAMVAMVAQLATTCNSNPNEIDPVSEHVVFAGASEAAWDGPVDVRSGIGYPHGRRSSDTPSKEGMERLANHSRQSDQSDRILRHAAGRGRMVSSIATLAVLLLGAAGGSDRRCVCGPDCWGKASASTEDQGDTQNISKFMLPSEVRAQGWRQQVDVLHHMPRVQQPLGERLSSYPTTQRLEAEQQDEKGPLESRTRGTDGSLRGGGYGIRGCDDQGRTHAAIEAGEGTQSEDPRPAAAGVEGAKECDPGSGDPHGSQDAVYDGGTGTAKAGHDVGNATASTACITTATADEESTGSTTYELTGSSGAMQLPAGGREAHRQEGRPEEGTSVFQVHATGVRVFPVGEASRRIECGQLECGELRGCALQTVTHDNDGKSKSQDAFREESEKQRRSAEPEKIQESSKEERKKVFEENAASQQQQQHTQHSIFMAEEGYEVMEEQGWKPRTGRVPMCEERPVRVKLHMNNRMMNEAKWDSGREVQFTSKQRKKIHQDMEILYQKTGGVHVSEVFSPPRITKLAKQRGLKPGEAYDLLTGWNLTDPVQRKAFWKKLKEEDPMVILICHPCKAFSILQSLNFQRMGYAAAFQLVELGLEHLRRAAAIMRWQIRRGKYVIYEQPDGARSWHEPEIEEILQMPETIRTTCDMCRYGMAVDGQKLNKKTTGILTNSPEIAQQLSKRCQGGHEHGSLLGGMAHKAEVYPRAFCEAIITGIRRQIHQNGGWHLFNQQKQSMMEVWAEEEEEADEVPDLAEDGVEVIGEGDREDSITEDQKRAIAKLHRGLGHPSLQDLVRFMKSARVRGEVVKWTHRHFRCETCEGRPKPKAVRVGSIPRTYQPNRVLGIDLIYIPEVGGKNLLPALSILDWGSNFQMVELLPNKDPDNVWQAMWGCWMRVFGCPEVIICDSGREFLADFVRKATGHGIVMFQAGARAPWQNGKTERHGAHYKELLEKARNETVLANEAELKLLMQEVESCKNRFANRSGFSPVQRQIGQWPRSPSELLSDEAIDPLLVSGALVDDVERLHEMRRIAQKAFVEHNARRTISQIGRARSKVPVEYKAGDYVYVYRVHKLRKRRDGGVQETDNPRNKPTWVGPGTVITVDGANLWVTVWGEL
eukprot:s1338_g4.t2